VKKLVIHHLGSGIAPIDSADELRRRANPTNYDYPEYDFGILSDGTIINMRPLTVIGAHTQADKPVYMFGKNWWNQNSASVVIGCDATTHAIPAAMREGLIRFITGFMQRQGFGLEGVYPHNQVTYTDCPGFDYAQLEREIKLRMEGDPVKIVFFFGVDDLIFARRVAEKVGGVIAPRTDLAEYPNPVFYVVGGSPVEGAAANITGSDFIETCSKFVEFMKG
jgi:hypothetical protein